jgi:hypothetical protein
VTASRIPGFSARTRSKAYGFAACTWQISTAS